MVSAIWSPMVYSGLSAVIGSWKIIAMSEPRSLRIAGSLLVSRSSPSRRIEPLSSASRKSRRMDNAVTLLPEPDSPTSATRSPASIVRLTPSTAMVSPKRTRRSVDFQQWRAH